MNFLIDMPLSPQLADWLKRQGHDAIHASSVGLDTAPDTDLLQRASAEERVVITADLDYPRLLALTQAQGPGVILFRGGDYSEKEALDRLQDLFETIPVDRLPTLLVVIERWRIRQRPLPLGPE